MRRSSLLAAGALAAFATYYLDPELGRRRRARARDRLAARLHHATSAVEAAVADLRNRAGGLLATLRRRLAQRAVADDILAERVRARLGRYISHPGAVTVSARAGTVTLSGIVFEHESRRLLRAVRAVPGVRRIASALEIHHEPGRAAALDPRARADQPGLMRERWSPATRLLVALAGGTLVGGALLRRTASSVPMAIAGGALLLRAGSNLALARLLGRRGPYIGCTKTIRIAAPVTAVFAFWQEFENFPHLMRHVRAVRRLQEGHSLWEVAGPLGTRVRWRAQTTAVVPDALIAWTTVPGSQVEHAGRVQFEADGNGTRLQVDLQYIPPGAAFGHLVAAAFGVDPVRALDEDLMRFKRFLETGMPAHDAAAAGAP